MTPFTQISTEEYGNRISTIGHGVQALVVALRYCPERQIGREQSSLSVLPCLEVVNPYTGLL